MQFTSLHDDKPVSLLCSLFPTPLDRFSSIQKFDCNEPTCQLNRSDDPLLVVIVQTNPFTDNNARLVSRSSTSLCHRILKNETNQTKPLEREGKPRARSVKKIVLFLASQRKESGNRARSRLKTVEQQPLGLMNISTRYRGHWGDLIPFS